MDKTRHWAYTYQNPEKHEPREEHKLGPYKTITEAKEYANDFFWRMNWESSEMQRRYQRYSGYPLTKGKCTLATISSEPCLLLEKLFDFVDYTTNVKIFISRNR